LGSFDIAWGSFFFLELVLDGKQLVTGNAYLLLVGFFGISLLDFGL